MTFKPQLLNKIFSDLKVNFQRLDLLTKTLVLICIFFGSLVRFRGLFELGYYFDMVETQYTWGKFAHNMGGFWIFWRDYPMYQHFDYPIISLIYENFLYLLSLPFGGTQEVFVSILKCVNWLVDIILILFLYHIWQINKNKDSENTDQQNSVKQIFLLLSLVYILPSIWFVSAIWGQNDTLIVLLSLACVWILFTKEKEQKLEQDLSNPKNNLNSSSKQEYISKISKNSNLPQKLKIVTNHGQTSFLGTIFLDKYFLAGSFFAISFLVKLQPVLILPIIFLYFFLQKTWLEILKLAFWVLPFLILLGFGASFYSQDQVFYSNSLTQSSILQSLFKFSGFNSSLISNWQIAAIIGGIVLILALLGLIISEIRDFLDSKKYSDSVSWLKLRRWALGFFLVFNILNLPLLALNYQRLARVIFAPFIRADQVSFGAANLWNLLGKDGKGSDILINFGNIMGTNLGININFAGYLIFIALNAFILYKILDLDFSKIRTLKLKVILGKNLELSDLIYFMMIFTSSYFLFLTKMHSRYLHFGIILSFVSYLFLPKSFEYKKSWLIASIFLNLAYFFNQMVVFSANNRNPFWVNNLGQSFNLNLMNLSSLISLICFGFLYYFLVKFYSKNK